MSSESSYLPDGISSYLDRGALLDAIKTKCDAQPTSIKHLAIVGITGSGKSELAKAYARRYVGLIKRSEGTPSTSSCSSQGESAIVEKEPLIYFIDASEDSYLTSFETFAEALNIDVNALRKRCSPDSAAKKRETYEQQLSIKIHHMLKRHPKWLLIMDGVTHLQKLRRLIPQGHGLTGTILYTLRDTHISVPSLALPHISAVSNNSLPSIDITDGLSTDEAVSLIEHLSGLIEEEKADVLNLVRILDRLPLAIQIAGRYIAYQRAWLPYEEYNYKTYFNAHQKTLQTLDERQHKVCDEQDIPRTQYAAIDLTFKSLSREGQSLLIFCSLFNNKKIPEEILRIYTTTFFNQPIDISAKEDVVFCSLQKCGFLNVENYKFRTWMLHYVTVAYVSSKFFHENILSGLYGFQLVGIVNTVFSHESYDDNETIENLNNQKRALFHVIAFLDKIKQYDKFDCTIGLLFEVLFKFSVVANKLGYPRAALTLLSYIMPVLEESRDKYSPTWLPLLNELGIAYGGLEEMANMKRAHERALAIIQKNGPQAISKESLAVTLTSLASVYQLEKDTSSAKQMLEGALSIAIAEFGIDNAMSATILTNLGYVHINLGELRVAEVYLNRALRIKVRHYGHEHYETAMTLGGLAECYKLQNKWHLSEVFYKRVLTIFESHYGADHYQTARRMIDLGRLRLLQGHFEEAMFLHQQALLIFNEHYDKQHPDVLTVTKTLDTIHHIIEGINNPPASITSSAIRENTAAFFKENALEKAPVINIQTLQTLYQSYNTQDKNKALRTAAYNGRLLDVCDLLNHGANANAPDDNPTSRKTALHRAYQKNHMNIVCVLLHFGADLTLADAGGHIPKDYLLLPLPPVTKPLKAVLELYKTKDKYKALRVATAIGRVEDVICLLNYCVYVDAADPVTGQTALHRAYMNNRQDIANLLISQGANESYKDSKGNTPYACLRDTSSNMHSPTCGRA